MSWITGTNFLWNKTKNICSKKMMNLISLYITLEQFLAMITTLHLFSVEWIFSNTFLIHFKFLHSQYLQLTKRHLNGFIPINRRPYCFFFFKCFIPCFWCLSCWFWTCVYLLAWFWEEPCACEHALNTFRKCFLQLFWKFGNFWF